MENKKYVVTVEFTSDGQHDDTEIALFALLNDAQDYYEKRIAEEMESNWFQYYQKDIDIQEYTNAAQDNLKWMASMSTEDFLIIRLSTVIEN